MKRTNWIDINYWHYYPDGLSGGILCGLFLPPGTKLKLNLIENTDDALIKASSVFFFSTKSDEIRHNQPVYADFRKILIRFDNRKITIFVK